MNIRNLRDLLICDSTTKCKIYKEKIRSDLYDYFNNDNEGLCIDLLTIHLEIVGLLLTSNDKSIRNEIIALKPKIYKKMRVVITNVYNNDYAGKCENFEDYMQRLEENKNKACEETTSDTFSEESECAFTWRDNKNTKSKDDKANDINNTARRDDDVQHSYRFYNRSTPSSSYTNMPLTRLYTQSQAPQNEMIYFTEVRDNSTNESNETRIQVIDSNNEYVIQSNPENVTNQVIDTTNFINTLNEAFGESHEHDNSIIQENNNTLQNELINNAEVNNVQQNQAQEIEEPHQNTNEILQIYNDIINTQNVAFRDETTNFETQNLVRNVYPIVERDDYYYTDIPMLLAPDNEPRSTRDDYTRLILSNLQNNRRQDPQNITNNDFEELFDTENNENDSTEVQTDVNENMGFNNIESIQIIPSQPFSRLYARHQNVQDTTPTQSQKNSSAIYEQNYSAETESTTKYIIKNDNKNTQKLLKFFQSIRFITKSIQMFDIKGTCFLIWLLKESFFDNLSYHYKSAIIALISDSVYYLCKTQHNRVIIREYDILKNMPINDKTVDVFRLILYKNSAKHKTLDDFIKAYDTCTAAKDKIRILNCAAKWTYLVENKRNDKSISVIMQKLNDNLFVCQDQTLIAIGKFIYNSINLQKYCLKTEMANQIMLIFDELYWKKAGLNPILFCLCFLIDKCEENRKIFFAQKVFHKVFDYFKLLIKDESFGCGFTLCLYFFKNMTRSIKFVRADLPEFPIVELLLFCLKKIIKTRNTTNTKIIELVDFKSECIVNQKKRCAYLAIKQILAILANLILEYGNYKEKFTKKGGLRLIKKLSNKKNLEHNVLFTLKNYVYECSILHKDYFYRVFAPKIIDNHTTNDINNNQNERNSNDTIDNQNVSYTNDQKDSQNVSIINNNNNKQNKNVSCSNNQNNSQHERNISNNQNNSQHDYFSHRYNNRQYDKNIHGSTGTHEESFITYNKKCLERISNCVNNNHFYYYSKTQKHLFIKILKKYKKSDLKNKTKASVKACKVLKELFNLIRNILCSNVQENLYFTDIYDDMVENLILIMYKLNKGVMYNEKNDVLKQLLYVFVNLTASQTKFKEMFMNDKILSELKLITANTNKKIMVVLIWLIINLTWSDDENYKNRIQKLTEYGFKKWLIDIKSTNAFINDKVITALENME